MACVRGLWRLRLASRHAVLYGSVEGRIPGFANSSFVVESLFKGFPTNPVASLWSSTTARTTLPACFCPVPRSFSTETGGVVSFPLPQTGEGIKECELISWFVKEGQSIIEFDKMCEVQSDKASVEITSRYSGTVLRLHAAEGDIVQVGAPLLDIQLEGSTQEAATEAVPPVPPPEAKAVTAAPAGGGPSGGGNAGVRASPAVRRIAREHHLDLAGVVGTGPGGRVTKEDLEAHIARSTGGGPEAQPSPMAYVQASGDVMGAGGVLDDVAETGTGSAPGQIRKEPEAGTGSAPGELRKEPPAPTGAMRGLTGASYEVPLRGYRRAMVKSMTAAGQVPHFHFCDEVSMDELLRVRNLLRPHANIKLTFLPFVIKAISVALRDFPEVNSSMRDDGNSLLVHGQHNIGVAMATPLGLVVPNIKGVESKSVVEIASEVARLQEAAASNRLQAGDLAEGTITVSNIGAIGGTYAAPLVNGREVAIVAIGKLQEVARFVDSPTGRVAVPALVMAVSWGADHRVLDGASLAKYSNAVKALLEQPERLLLHLT